MAAQFAHKYLPGIDGNSFSGRYLGFVRSTSAPMKATLWREWHDALLLAWKHFVPMDSRFGDWWGILGYFLGGEGQGKGKKGRERARIGGGEDCDGGEGLGGTGAEEGGYVCLCAEVVAGICEGCG